jgi:hypothetical protein
MNIYFRGLKSGVLSLCLRVHFVRVRESAFFLLRLVTGGTRTRAHKKNTKEKRKTWRGVVASSFSSAWVEMRSAGNK